MVGRWIMEGGTKQSKKRSQNKISWGKATKVRAVRLDEQTRWDQNVSHQEQNKNKLICSPDHEWAVSSSRKTWASTASRSRKTTRCRPHRRCAARAGTGRWGWTCGSCGTTRRRGRRRRSCSLNGRCPGLWWWTSSRCVSAESHLKGRKGKTKKTPHLPGLKA